MWCSACWRRAVSVCETDTGRLTVLCAQALLDAGATLVGKVHMDELVRASLKHRIPAAAVQAFTLQTAVHCCGLGRPEHLASTPLLAPNSHSTVPISVQHTFLSLRILRKDGRVFHSMRLYARQQQANMVGCLATGVLVGRRECALRHAREPRLPRPRARWLVLRISGAVPAGLLVLV